MTKFFNIKIGLLAILYLVGVAGCGGGGNATSGGEPGPPQTTAAFIRQADLICQKRHEEISAKYEAFRKELGGELTLGDRETVVNTIVIPSLQDERALIGELGPPKGHEGDAEALVQALETTVQAGETNPLAILGEKAWAPVQKAAEKIGLKVCISAT